MHNEFVFCIVTSLSEKRRNKLQFNSAIFFHWHKTKMSTLIYIGLRTFVILLYMSEVMEKSCSLINWCQTICLVAKWIAIIYYQGNIDRCYSNRESVVINFKCWVPYAFWHFVHECSKTINGFRKSKFTEVLKKQNIYYVSEDLTYCRWSPTLAHEQRK